MNYTERGKLVNVVDFKLRISETVSVSRSECHPSNFWKTKWVSFDLQLCWRSCLLLLRF